MWDNVPHGRSRVKPARTPGRRASRGHVCQVASARVDRRLRRLARLLRRRLRAFATLGSGRAATRAPRRRRRLPRRRPAARGRSRPREPAARGGRRRDPAVVGAPRRGRAGACGGRRLCAGRLALDQPCPPPRRLRRGSAARIRRRRRSAARAPTSRSSASPTCSSTAASTRTPRTRGRTSSQARWPRRGSRSAASATRNGSAMRSSPPTSRSCAGRWPVSADLATTVAGLELKNPVLAGSSEATATPDQIRACLEAGAAAVVAKSVNESPAAHANLRAAEYVLLDDALSPRPLGPARRTDSLFCRSGLLDVELDEWAETLAALDREAAEQGAYVVPSLIVADLARAVEAAAAFERAGLRWLELNVGAPHASEAAEGIGAGVELVRGIRQAVSLPLTVKLAASDSAAEALAAGAYAVCIATRAMGFLPDL